MAGLRVVKPRMSYLWAPVHLLTRTRGAGFGLATVLLVLAIAFFSPWIAPYDPLTLDANRYLEAPSMDHLFGTDEIGRDNLSRIIWGSRTSLQVGIISVGLALVVGIPCGLLGGFRGGWVDHLLMRVVDAVWSFPTVILALAVGAALGPGLLTSCVAVGIVFTPVTTRLVRAQTLCVRETDYVLAARSSGARPARMMWIHIWPNVLGPLVVQCSILMPSAILAEATLSFLGLGVQPPTPAWGSMLRAAYQYLFVSPWQSIFPGAAIFVTVLGFNLLGDGLRQALDPRLRRAKG